jgi:ribonucleoside-diphosphate reductase alpha chain
MQSTAELQPAREGTERAISGGPREQARAGSREERNSSAEPGKTHGDYSPPPAVRTHLPDERFSVTHKFSIGGHEGYITVGLYPDRRPGELFITMAKEGSTVSGLISSFAQAISLGLQHGVPLELFCEKFSHTRFEPSGWSGHPDIRHASSVMDYIFRWLELKFGTAPTSSAPLMQRIADEPNHAGTQLQDTSTVNSLAAFSDAPSCKHCGSITTRNGSCYICTNCGSSSGCS